MSTTTKPGSWQPALIGGAVMGALSALPLISAGNLCCCLWMVSGGAVAAYVFQQNQETPMTPGDGALAGLLAGIVGAFIYLVLSIPIGIVMAPMERVMLERILRNGSMPPEFRNYVGTNIGTALRVVFGFLFTFVFGCIFSTLGGLLGAAIFKKQVPDSEKQMHDSAQDPP